MNTYSHTQVPSHTHIQDVVFASWTYIVPTLDPRHCWCWPCVPVKFHSYAVESGKSLSPTRAGCGMKMMVPSGRVISPFLCFRMKPPTGRCSHRTRGSG